MAVVMTVIATLPVFLTGALGVELRQDLGLSITQLGAVVSVFFVLSATSAGPLGRLGDRLSPCMTLRAGATITAAALASAAMVADSFGALLGCIAAAGVGNGLTQPAVNALLARRVSTKRLGLAFGFKQSAIPIAVLLSGVSVPAIALTVGWRGAFGAGALFALAAALTIHRLIAPAAARQPRSGRGHMRRSLLLSFAIAGGLAAMGANALAAFLVSSAVNTGIPQGVAGLLLAAGSCVAVLVRIGTGALADHGQSDGLLPFVALILGGSLGLLALASSQLWLFAAGTLLAFGGAWGWPGLFNFAIVVHNSHAPAAATGMGQAIVSLGSAAGPLTFGVIAASSYDAAFAAMAGLALVGAALAETVRRSLRAASPA